jgi:hypothetical protein
VSLKTVETPVAGIPTARPAAFLKEMLLGLPQAQTMEALRHGRGAEAETGEGEARAEATEAAPGRAAGADSGLPMSVAERKLIARIDLTTRGIDMERLELLKAISFGERVAEDETTALARYFVETDQWERILKGEIDVVRGEKGSGKSAIYSLLIARADELFDKGILLTTGENPRGATVFKDLVSEPPTSEQEFVGLWKLYLVTLVAQQLRDFGVSGKDYDALIEILEDQDLLEPDSDFDLARAFKQARNYASSWFKPRSLEGSFAIDPNTLIPTFAGKIVPGEPSKEERDRGVVSVDRLAWLANKALEKAGIEIWVLLDRLDVAFIDSHDLETNALRALFRVYRDFAALDRIKLKIFLRSDIWKRITETGFREASHITKVAVLDWKPASLLNLIVKRLLNNPALIKEFGIDAKSVLRDFRAQSDLFYRFFPKQVEQGSRKSTTLDWIISRCADASGKTAPREIIHLLNSAREQEVARVERGENAPPGDIVFDHTVFKPALATVSEARLVQTIFAEYPDLKPWLTALEGEKTEQTLESLSAIWKTSEGEAARRAQLLVEIGFFEKRESGGLSTFWVPFLYRDGLFLSQGLAEE